MHLGRCLHDTVHSLKNRIDLQIGLVSADAMLTGSVTRSDQTSEDYIVGASGQILGDAGKNFSISRAPGYLQSQACNMVLERAKTFRRQH